MIKKTLEFYIVWMLISIGIGVIVLTVVDSMTGYMVLEAWQYITTAFVTSISSMIIGYFLAKVATKTNYDQNKSASHSTSKELQE